MTGPTLSELPPPPAGKTGWPWTEASPPLPETQPGGSPWPRISIVTPSYNQGQFIEEAIRSVLLQGYPDLEYIIIDGGSTDGAVDIIRRYEPWLAYWVSEPDRGQSHAINKGLARSTGKYFNWHNSDDVLTPGSLAATAQAMVENPQASYVFGYTVVIDEQSQVVYENSRHPLLTETGFFRQLAWSVRTLKTGAQPGSLMDRALVMAVGGVNEELHYNMDTELSLKLALIRTPFYIKCPVVHFRRHVESKTAGWASARRATERLRIARKLFQRPDLPPEISALRPETLAAAHRFAWQCYIEAGAYPQALWHCLREMGYRPTWPARRRTLYKAWHKLRFG